MLPQRHARQAGSRADPERTGRTGQQELQGPEAEGLRQARVRHPRRHAQGQQVHRRKCAVLGGPRTQEVGLSGSFYGQTRRPQLEEMKT